MILFKKKQTKQQQQKKNNQTNKKPQKWKHSEKPSHSGFIQLTVEISIAHYVEVNLGKKKKSNQVRSYSFLSEKFTLFLLPTMKLFCD